MKHRIIFFGSGGYTISVIQMLKDRGLRFVFTTEFDGKLVQFLKKEHISYISSHLQNLKEIELIKKEKPTLGVLASYGSILPREVLNLFPLGIFNIHPSLLPKYRGPSPIQTTILNGEKVTGVTIIKLDEEVDHGPVVAQKKVSLSGTETTENLKELLFSKGAEMIEEIIQKMEKGHDTREKPQNHKKATFTNRLTRKDGYIDINNPPAPDMLDRMKRAYYPWPSAWTKCELRIAKSEIIKFLPNQKIQVEGGREMTYRDFINGYQQAGRKFLEKLGVALSRVS